ncbi:GNAT family N-acetyltransferase [Mesobacterium pallidum]|uniref:GNAT family N-acetyltransferase n=1 Tax=Mesobacterium pallidum TaxID=2872037 RepID=UPI001EE2542A|nr:GNAT family N-acetyltransferase [Mesobacterium pallidum]
MTDADTLAALHAAAERHTQPWSAAQFTGSLEDPSSFLSADPHSFALGRAVLDEAELLLIATHPDAQRRGLARARLAEFAGLARARGATRGFLEVAAGNAPALALYTATGWSVCGRRRGYYRLADGRTEDAILMEIAL